MRELESRSAEETERIGGELAATLAPGDVVLVSGDLGSGKTTLVRGACRALGVTSPVTSPTYAIGNRYAGRVDVSHLDLYRLETVGEDDWADLEPYFDASIAFVEWPELAEAFLPPPRLRIRLRLLGDVHRIIHVEDRQKDLEIGLSSPC
jgi:tRNA threonylcarbamoyladenosine biosynthesis protein TsaE